MGEVHERFRRAVESADLEGMLGSLSDDAVLHSPVSFKPFEGREAIRPLFAILLEVFEGFRYTDELEAADGTHALIFECTVDGRDVQGLDLMRVDDTGQINDFTVMVRPRSAVEALMSAVGSRLAKAGAASQSS